MHRSVAAFMLLTTVAACASSGVVPTTANPATQEPGVSADQPESSISRNSWTFTSTDISHKYHSVTKTKFQLNSTNIEDSISVVTEFTTRLDLSQRSTAITGHINNILITPGVRIGLSSQRELASLTFKGIIAKGRVVLGITSRDSSSQVDNRSCDTPVNTALADVRATLITLPSPLLRTSAWTDTISTTTCAASKIPLQLEIVRSYATSGEIDYQGKPTILIKRTETTHISGAGAQGQHQVVIEGEGSSIADLYLDQTTGLILAVQAHQNLKLAVTTSGRLQHFDQLTDQEIAFKP